jgi:flagellar hook-associated protein 2
MATTDAINTGAINIDPKTNKVSVKNLAGFDSQAAVDALVKVKKIPIDRIQSTIDTNTQKITAYNDLRAKLKSLQDSASLLYGKLSFDKSNDIFQSKLASGSTTRTSGTAPSFDSMMGITALNSAAAGNHSMSVIQRATNNQIAATNRTSSTTALGYTGSFAINGAAISVAANDTLNSIRDKINGVNTGTNATGVTASIVNITPGVFTLVLSSDKTGVANTIKMTDGDGVLQNLGLATSINGTLVAKRTLSQAQDAQFTLDNYSTTVDASPGNTTLTGLQPLYSRTVTGLTQTLGSALSGFSFPSGTESLTINKYASDGVTLQGSSSISVNADMTVGQFLDAVNSTTATTNTQATLEGGRIKFSAKDPSQNNQIVLQGQDNLLSDGLNLGQTAVTSNILSRSSNTINDLLPGLTLDLRSADAQTTINFTVGQDTGSIKSAIVNYATAYNDLREFINKQTLTDPNTGGRLAPTKDANGEDIPGTGSGPLYSEIGFSTMRSSITGLVTSATAGVSKDFAVLSQIGFSRIQNGTGVDPLTVGKLTLDNAKLDSALATNLDDIRKLFSFNLTASNQSFQAINFDAKTMSGSGSVAINYSVDATGKVTADIGGDATAIQMTTDNTFKVVKGAAKGLEFIYNGVANTSGSFTATYTAGLATKMNTQINKYLEQTTGTLDSSINTLSSGNTSSQKSIDNMNRALDSFRESQLQRFQALEAALAQAQSTRTNITNAFFKSSN